MTIETMRKLEQDYIRFCLELTNQEYNGQLSKLPVIFNKLKGDINEGY